MAERAYDGPAIDATGQHITESPHWQGDGETVAATEDGGGQSTTEEVSLPDGGVFCQFPGCEQLAHDGTYCEQCRAACIGSE